MNIYVAKPCNKQCHKELKSNFKRQRRYFLFLLLSTDVYLSNVHTRVSVKAFENLKKYLFVLDIILQQMKWLISELTVPKINNQAHFCMVFACGDIICSYISSSMVVFFFGIISLLFSIWNKNAFLYETRMLFNMRQECSIEKTFIVTIDLSDTFYFLYKY